MVTGCEKPRDERLIHKRALVTSDQGEGGAGCANPPAKAAEKELSTPSGAPGHILMPPSGKKDACVGPWVLAGGSGHTVVRELPTKAVAELMPTPCSLLEQSTTEFQDLNWAVAFAEALLCTQPRQLVRSKGGTTSPMRMVRRRRNSARVRASSYPWEWHDPSPATIGPWRVLKESTTAVRPATKKVAGDRD